MRKNRGKMVAVFLSVIMVVLSACGNGSSDVQETVAPAENETEERREEIALEEELEEKEPERKEIEETEEEEAPIIPYADANELEFCEDLTVAIKGVRTDINDDSVYEEVDAECVIKDVSIDEMEDGTKSITIKYEVTGEIYDSYEKRLLHIVMPNAVCCDLNTGGLQPVSGEIQHDRTEESDYTVEWNGAIYNITQIRTMEWSSDTELDWKPDGKGGYIKPVTMYVTDALVVPKDYDGMGMIIGMFTADEIYSCEYELFKDANPLILEVLEKRDGARLYSINKLCKLFSEDETVADDADTKIDADNSSTASANNGTSKENTNNSSSKDNTTVKQEQPTHTHSYTSSVTKNPSCGENGVMTYTCSCGSSYTEAIPASGHQWTTTTETISHPSTGHYETVTKKEAFCNCGFTGSSQAEMNAHWENDNCGSTTGGVREWTDNVWVVDNPEWQETITINKCSICGINQ